MKNILAIHVVFLGVFFLTGCRQQPVSQPQPTTLSPKAQPTTNQPAPAASHMMIWKSEAQGDYVHDDRDPNGVCKKIQSDQELNDCRIVISKRSNDKSECVDGMSVAGCFACKFECPSTQPSTTNPSAPITPNDRTDVQCTKDSDCAHLKTQEPCFKNNGSLTLTPYCIDNYCECRCGRNNDGMCD